jgi:hypothetical protein
VKPPLTVTLELRELLRDRLLRRLTGRRTVFPFLTASYDLEMVVRDKNGEELRQTPLGRQSAASLMEMLQPEPSGLGYCPQVSPDGRWATARAADNTLRLMDLKLLLQELSARNR